MFGSLDHHKAGEQGLGLGHRFNADDVLHQAARNQENVHGGSYQRLMYSGVLKVTEKLPLVLLTEPEKSTNCTSLSVLLVPVLL